MMSSAWRAQRAGIRRGAVVRAAGACAALAMLGVLAVGAAENGQGGSPPVAAEQKEPDITFVEDDAEPTAETAPAASPFGERADAGARKDAVRGYIELSTGAKLPGRIYTTRAKRLKIYNIEHKVYEYVPVPACKRMEVIVEWERDDKEWRFKEAGNPEKVYTGRSYPVRSLAWRLTLRNDHEVVGHILGQPLYVREDGKAERYILHQRDKGPMGGSLADVAYIRRVVLGQEAYDEAVAELKAKADAAGQPKAK